MQLITVLCATATMTGAGVQNIGDGVGTPMGIPPFGDGVGDGVGADVGTCVGVGCGFGVETGVGTPPPGLEVGLGELGLFVWLEATAVPVDEPPPLHPDKVTVNTIVAARFSHGVRPLVTHSMNCDSLIASCEVREERTKFGAEPLTTVVAVPRAASVKRISTPTAFWFEPNTRAFLL